MNTKVYEIGMLLYPSLTESEAEQAFSDVKTKLGSTGAEITSSGELAYIDLAYEMVKKLKSKNVRFNEAHFSWVKFTATVEQVAEVKKTFDAIENMLRYILVETIASDELTNKFIAEEEEEAEVDVNDGVDEGSAKVEETKDSDTNPTDSDAQDDLTKIEGVGPKIAELFTANSIATFADLKGASVEKLNTLLDENGLGNHDPATWPAQANLAFEGNWDELKALQEELHGGKE